MRLALRLAVLSTALLPSVLSAQSYLTAIGTPNGSTTIPFPEGFVSVSNGNLHIEIPISSPTQRGGVLSAAQSLMYDSRIWQVPQGTTQWQPTNGGTQAGWHFMTPLLGQLASIRNTQYCDTYPPKSESSTTTYTYTEPNGTLHLFPVTIFQQVTHNNPCYDPSQPNITTGDGTATDASGFHLFVTNAVPVVYDRNGVQVYPKVEDTNGNYLSAGTGGMQDTSGNVSVVTTVSGANTYYDVLGFQGARNRYTVTTSQIAVQTHFNQSPNSEYTGNLTAIQSITLPGNGGSYQFAYDSYGELSSLTLPTGGVITYNYAYFVDAYGNPNRWLYSRVADGGTWKFVPAVISSCDSGSCTQKLTATNPGPASGDTVYSFTLNGGAYTNRIDRYNGSSSAGTPVETIATDYDLSHTCDPTICNGASYVRASTQTRTLNEVGQSSAIQINYDSPTTGNVTSVKSWDFYSGTRPDTPTKEVDYTYGYTRTNAQPALTKITESDLTSGTPIVVSETDYGYDGTLVPTSNLPNHETGSSTPGNLTSTAQWVNTQAGNADPFLHTTVSFDDAGRMQSTTGPSGTTTISSYDGTGVFPTNATSPVLAAGLQLSVSGTVDPSGLPLTSVDANSQTTSYVSFDAQGRPLEVHPPVGKTTYAYTATQASEHDFIDQNTSTDTETLYDGFGRISRTEVANGQSSNPWYQQDTCYDVSGRLSFRSIRYQGSGFAASKNCSGQGTSYSYDGLGRLISSGDGLDGNNTYYTYGRAVKTTDVNNIVKVIQRDAFGRTTAVCEGSSNSAMPGSGTPADCGLDIPLVGFLTTYAYSPGTHTVTVTQGVQTRITQTDSLGRTVSFTEPEAGVTTYTYSYNSTGLLTQRTRPRANQTDPTVKTVTAAQADALGRVISISYDGTVAKAFTYDSIASGNSGRGRLTSFSTPTGTASSFVYDTMGNVTSSSQCFPGQCGQTGGNVTRSYSYDWTGRLTQDQYSPTSTQDFYTYSLANELTGISNNTTGVRTNTGAVLNAVTNGPFGPTSYTLGNQLYGFESYDALGRNSGRSFCTVAGSSACSGGSTIYSASQQTRGLQVQSSSDTVVGTGNTFTYDEFNRLASSSFPTQGNSFGYTYDRYGNRWAQTVTGGQGTNNPGQFSPTFNVSNNQITQPAYNYDAAGGLTNNVDHTFTYDPDGNVIAVDNGATATYVYDALNRRVQATVGTAVTNYGYDAFSQRVSTWDGTAATPALLSSTTYWNGRPLQTILNGATPKAYYYHQDLTGTERVITGYNQAVSTSYQSLPFGDMFVASGNSRDDLHFAGLEYDAESDSHHAQFRQYSANQGRWFSPDPYNGSYNPSDPQSFNRYTYAANNPLFYIDPLGLIINDASAGGSVDVYADPDQEDPDNDFSNVFFRWQRLQGQGQGGGGSSSGGGGGGGASGPAPNNNQQPQQTPQQQRQCNYYKRKALIGGAAAAVGIFFNPIGGGVALFAVVAQLSNDMSYGGCMDGSSVDMTTFVMQSY